MRFLLQTTIEFPDAPVDVFSEAEAELNRECSWLRYRCDLCGLKPKIRIHEVREISPRAFAVFWSESYCCEQAALSAALEFDQEMVDGIIKSLHPESQWRPWLDGRT